MPIPVSWPVIGGASYSVPQTGETNWGALTNYLVALSSAQGTTAQKVASRLATSTPVIVTSATDCAIIVRLTVPGPSTVQLPAGVNGQFFNISDGRGDAGTNNITVLPFGTDTINGVASFVINSNNDAISLIYNTSSGNWKITSQILSFTPGSVSRASIQAGTPNYVVINAAGTGFLSEEQYLNQIRGGFGTNTSLFTGVVKAATGAFSASLILNGDIDPLAAIDALKIGTGVVDNSEFARLNEIGILYSTTKVSGGVGSVNGGNPALFDVSAGTAKKTDYVGTPATPVITNITFGPLTAQTVTNLATADFTYVSVSGAGSLVQQTTFPTPSEQRTNQYLFRINHSNRVSIGFIDNVGNTAQSIGNQYCDLIDALGPFNITGNVVSANGANLSFNKSAGQMFSRYFNQVSSPLNPHYATNASSTIASFKYATRTTVAGANVTVVDPTNYDVAGVVTAVPGGGNTSTIQRVFLYPSNNYIVQYGQNTYATLADAIAAVNSESFVINPVNVGLPILIGYIIMQKNCVALNAGTARILNASRFDAGAGGGSGGTTTLQGAYLNSVVPLITLSAGIGTFNIRDNAAPLGTALFNVQNNAGAISYIDVSAQGIKSNQFPTASRVMVTDVNSAASQSSVTATEVGFLAGTTGVTGTGSIVRNSGASVTLFDFDGGTASNTSRVTIPKDTFANLLGLTRKEGTILYATDLDVFLADDGITLTPIGSGSTGVKNYIPNPNNATNWVASGAGIAVATETTASNFPDNITQRQCIRITRASGADYVRTRLTMDQADYSKLCGILMDLKYSGAAGDYTISLFTNTASNYLGTYVQVTLPTTSIPSLSSGGSLQTSGLAGGSGTQYMELRINGIAGTTPLYLNNVTFTPNAPAQAAAISDPVAATFTGSWVTNTTYTAFETRIGSWAKYEVKVLCSGAPTAAGLQLILPAGRTIDTTKIFTTLAEGGNRVPNSVVSVNDTGVAGYVGSMYFAGNSTTLNVGYEVASGTNTTTAPLTNAAPIAFGNTDFVICNFFIPIAEWSGSGTVNLGPGAQVEYAWNSDTTDTSTTASGFSYGPDGVLFGSFSTATRVKRVRFQYPVQAGDIVELQLFDTIGNKWINSNQSIGTSISATTGISLSSVSGSTTDIDVMFGSAGYAATPRAVASAWSGVAGNFRWRVIKATPSSPVGFGLAGTDGSAGLYKAGQAPGLTTGISIPSLYVGETFGTQRSGTNGFTFSLRSTTNATSSDTVVNTQTLNKGSYLVSITTSHLISAGSPAQSEIFIAVGGTAVTNRSFGTLTATGQLQSQTIAGVPITISADGTAVAHFAKIAGATATTSFHEMWIVRNS